MVLSIDDYLFPDLCTAQQAQDFIRSRCEKGELGIKTGKGIYDLVLEHKLMSEEELHKVLQPENMVHPRKKIGE